MTVTETRSKSIEENIKKLESQLQVHMTETSKKTETTDAKIDDLTKNLGMLMDRLLPNHVGILGATPTGNNLSERSGVRLPMDKLISPRARERSQPDNHNSRVEFPYFDGAPGADPCSWLRKCERYFHYNHITEVEEKLELAVLHLNGKAEAWFFSIN